MANLTQIIRANYRKSSIKPWGAYSILDVPQGGLNREGAYSQNQVIRIYLVAFQLERGGVNRAFAVLVLYSLSMFFCRFKQTICCKCYNFYGFQLCIKSYVKYCYSEQGSSEIQVQVWGMFIGKLPECKRVFVLHRK